MRKILSGEPADPPVQEALNVVIGGVELEDFLDDLRQAPVLLEPVSLNAETAVPGDIGFPESVYLSGDMVQAFVVVHEPRFPLLKCCVVFGLLAKDFGFGGC